MAFSLGQAFIGVRAKMGDLQKDLARAEGVTKKSLKNVTKQAADMGKKISVAGVAVGGVLLAAAKTAADFGTAMAEVNTLGVKDLNALSDAVRDSARTFGLDLTTSANAAYQAISAGASEMEAPEILNKAAKAATAGVTDLATAIDLGMGTMNAFGDSVSDINEVFDSAFLAVKNGVTTFEQLSASMGQLSPVFQGAGLSMDEMFASVAALTKGGIQTSIAVTNMKAAISNIVKPSESAAKAAHALGVGFDVATLKTKGLKKFLDDLFVAAEGDIEIMGQFFGSTEALTAVMALAGAQAQSFGQILGDMGNKTGATQEAFQLLIESDPAFAFRVLKAEITDLSVTIGEQLLPIMIDFAGELRPVVEDISEWIEKNPELTKQIVDITVKVTALAVALGPIIIILGGLNTALQMVTTAFVTLKGWMVAIVASSAVMVGAVAHDFFMLVKEAGGLVNAIRFFGRAFAETIGHFFINPVRVLTESVQIAIRKLKELFGMQAQGGGPAPGPGLGGVGQNVQDAISQNVGEAIDRGLGAAGYASGTTNAARGLALVGERGPELVMMRGGERVFNARETSGMMGGVNVTVNANVSSDVDVNNLAVKLGNLIYTRQRAQGFA